MNLTPLLICQKCWMVNKSGKVWTEDGLTFRFYCNECIEEFIKPHPEAPLKELIPLKELQDEEP